MSKKHHRAGRRDDAEAAPEAAAPGATVAPEETPATASDSGLKGAPAAASPGGPSPGAVVAAHDGAGVSEGAAGAAPSPPEPAAPDLTTQLAEAHDRYLRLAAEYDNYRKRTSRERLEGTTRAQADLVARMLDALDDLSRFAHVDPAATDSPTLHKGIELVEQKLLKVLASAGLEIINPVDQTFDPTQHEAVTTEPALSAEDDHTVARVFQPGYRFNGQLLRPARVVVKQWNG